VKPASLSRTADFRRVYAEGKRSRRDGISVVAAARNDDRSTRIAYAVRRSAGPAVTRNRIKRRLRAATRELEVVPGMDIVISGDHDAASIDFQVLVSHLGAALRAAGAAR